MIETLQGLKRMNRRELLRQSAWITGAACVAVARDRFAGAATTAPEATLTSGRIRGFVDRGIYAFKGIPYGADTAPRRFLAPVAPKSWTGIRDATEFGSRAPQPSFHFAHGPRRGYYLPPDTGPISEDCLYLNVWTPGLRDHRKRPVMVYIHGGGYDNGSANNVLYNGVNLCRRGDVVVVTLNHRLNMFGFLYLADLAPGFADSGNTGMLDLVLALEWVRDNIEEFGGDPGRVLIFGQSGGGAKCATLMDMPAGHGLFHRVLTMSGEQVTASRRDSATARTRKVLDALNLPVSRIEEIRTMPMQQLLGAYRAAGYYGPVKDDRNILRDPFDPDATPLSAAIPMIIGNTHDETRILIGGGDPSTFSLTWQTLPAKLKQHAEYLGDLNLDRVIADYRRWYPNYTASDVFFAATTASRSWRPAIIEAERRAAQPAAQPHTWAYELDWPSPVDGGKWGAPHMLDIPLNLDTVDVAPGMTGDGPDAQRMAGIMSGMCVHFARTGNPNNAVMPYWSPYNLEERATMCFKLPPRLVNDPRGKERRLIEQVPYIQRGT
jgi:para-nitrobenzyl esterase